MNKTKTNKPAPMPTALNLYTLASVFQSTTRSGFEVQVPNAIPSTKVNGIKRCMAFGLVTATKGGELWLTELGQNALMGWAFDGSAGMYF